MSRAIGNSCIAVEFARNVLRAGMLRLSNMDDGRWQMDEGQDKQHDVRARGDCWRVWLWIGVVIASWLGMQIVHECGHVLGALASGGRVMHVELKPWTISRTDVDPNPDPLFERWSGPIFGSVAPLAGWIIVRVMRRSWAYLLRFFAGFCLIANGAYLGVGAIWPVGDAADILRVQPARWPLLAFGTIAVVAGFLLWHRLGPAYGIGPQSRPISARHVMGVWCVVGVIAAMESVI